MEQTTASEERTEGFNWRSTPVARLKRRILLRRTRVFPSCSSKSDNHGDEKQSSLSTERDSDKVQNPTPIHKEHIGTQIPKDSKSLASEKDPETSIANVRVSNRLCQRPKTPQLEFSKQESPGEGSSVEIHQVQITDTPIAKTQQPQPRTQTYLERWKAAQLESRPCTSQGLLDLQCDGKAKQRSDGNIFDRIRNTLNSNRKSLNPEIKRDFASVSLDGNGVSHLKKTGQVRTDRTLPANGNQLTVQLEKQISSRQDSLNYGMPEQRPFTSLGTLTPTGKHNASFHNRKTVAFDTRPDTPWVIARRHDRSFTESNESQTERRPPTPGLRFGRNSDSISPEKREDLQLKPQSSNEGVSLVKSMKLADPENISCSPTGGRSQDNNPRRIVIARSAKTSGRIGSAAEASETHRNNRPLTSNEHHPTHKDVSPAWRRHVNNVAAKIASRLRDSSMKAESKHDETLGERESPKLKDLVKSNGYRNGLHKHPHDTSSARNGIQINGESQDRHQFSRFIPTTHLDRCKSTPTVLELQTGCQATADNPERDQRILSWLGDCEDSSTPSYLPLIPPDG